MGVDMGCVAWISVCDNFFFFQAEESVQDLVRSRGVGDVYMRHIVDIRDSHIIGSASVVVVHSYISV